jgi:Protein of unknown function (DUF1236)
MFNRFMITAATAALVAGTGFAFAQGNMGHEPGGAGMQQSAPSSPSGGAASHAGSAGMKSSQSEEKGGAANRSAQHEMKSGAEKGTVGQSAGEKEKSAQESGKGEKSKGMSSQNERGATGKDMKAEDQRNGNMKAQGKERNDNMKAEGQQHNGNTKAEGPNNMNTGANTAAEGRAQTTGQAGAGARLSTEQRTRITSIIRGEHVAPVNNINFAVSVGTRVPAGIGFHPLPADIVSIYPDWRGYEFFLAHEQIVVVDPRTLEIVAVLEA